MQITHYNVDYHLQLEYMYTHTHIYTIKNDVEDDNIITQKYRFHSQINAHMSIQIQACVFVCVNKVLTLNAKIAR